MGSTDFDALTGTLDTSKVRRSVSMAFNTPAHSVPALNDFVYAFRTASADAGVSALYVLNTTGINVPTLALKGGVISAVMKRYSSGTKYAPFIGLIAGDDVTADQAYLLGLTQGAPYRIALRKGLLTGGLDATASDLLRLSTNTYPDVGDTEEAWKHLKMDVIVNPHGEVVLNVYQNDLSVHTVDLPVWEAIPGMSNPYVDDPLGILSGSVPLTGGFRFCFGMYTQGEAGLAALFDYIEVAEQVTP